MPITTAAEAKAITDEYGTANDYLRRIEKAAEQGKDCVVVFDADIVTAARTSLTSAGFTLDTTTKPGSVIIKW